MKVSIKFLLFITLATLAKCDIGDTLQSDIEGDQFIKDFESKGTPHVIETAKTTTTKDSFIQSCINYVKTRNSKLLGPDNAKKANEKYQSKETLSKIANINEKSYKFGYNFREKFAKKFHKYFDKAPKLTKRDGTSVTAIESFNNALIPVEEGLMTVLDAILKNEYITQKMVMKLEQPNSYVASLFVDPKKVVIILKDKSNLIANERILIKRRFRPENGIKISLRAYYVYDSFTKTIGLFGIIILILLFLPLVIGIVFLAAGILVYTAAPLIGVTLIAFTGLMFVRFFLNH